MRLKKFCLNRNLVAAETRCFDPGLQFGGTQLGLGFQFHFVKIDLDLGLGIRFLNGFGDRAHATLTGQSTDGKSQIVHVSKAPDLKSKCMVRIPVPIFAQAGVSADRMGDRLYTRKGIIGWGLNSGGNDV